MNGKILKKIKEIVLFVIGFQLQSIYVTWYEEGRFLVSALREPNLINQQIEKDR